MTSQENRQAGRVLRLSRALENILFDMIAELQDGQRMHDEPFDWSSIEHQLGQIRDQLPLLFDLVHAIRREANV